MYTKLEMSEYLLPFNSQLNIDEKRCLFEIRNRMSKIPINFGNKEAKCICGEEESMSHVYSCKFINKAKPSINYNEIYNGNLNTQIEIFRRMEWNLEKREQIKNEQKHPCDPCDPPYCQYGIG